ncbi:formylglycine-generating enzyme family protein [Spongiimicrobium sp. 2-473A-2-J]|uniref:formylglycine-generating enzyme family protein n=1 Tax=Eudoraea algarum TaxID=3417568 RepID=UPI003D36CE28
MKHLFVYTFLWIGMASFANDLTISRPILYQENGTSYTVLQISWDNAWHNKTNHDAVWVFFKLLNNNWNTRHVKVLPSGHEVVSTSNDKDLIRFEVPSDSVGLFLKPGKPFRGKIQATLKIMLDQKSFENADTYNGNFSAYGIEMVHIPKGGFILGEADTSKMDQGTLYRSNASGEFKGLFPVTAENQVIEIGPGENKLYYQAPEAYRGDQAGTIPAAFPKGVNPFYIMKYEPTQGQYARFLNALSPDQSQHRANFGGKDYYANRGSIVMEHGVYTARVPDALCNYISWDDAMAYADWAGLRPLTEFEFTKAARGTGKPGKNEFPWGTSSKSNIQRSVTDDGVLVMAQGLTESQLSDENKEWFAASFYWVMDLSGGLWERVISIGHPKGRAYLGTHGDGVLTNYGFATNEDWPKGVQETGGFGFRGGGFYGYGRAYHDFNPYSPVGYRPFGGWSGGNRAKAYGGRFGRTVNE